MAWSSFLDQRLVEFLGSIFVCLPWQSVLDTNLFCLPREFPALLICWKTTIYSKNIIKYVESTTLYVYLTVEHSVSAKVHSSGWSSYTNYATNFILFEICQLISDQNISTFHIMWWTSIACTLTQKAKWLANVSNSKRTRSVDVNRETFSDVCLDSVISRVYINRLASGRDVVCLSRVVIDLLTKHPNPQNLGRKTGTQAVRQRGTNLHTYCSRPQN